MCGQEFDYLNLDKHSIIYQPMVIKYGCKPHPLSLICTFSHIVFPFYSIHLFDYFSSFSIMEYIENIRAHSASIYQHYPCNIFLTRLNKL